MRNKNHKIYDFIALRIFNPVIRILIISELVITSSFGLVTPILAVFITSSIEDGSVAVAGIATAIFLLSKSIFIIPIAIVIDNRKGEKDDFWTVLIGSIVFSLVPLFYLTVNTPMQLYIIQFVYGISSAAISPGWNAIWVRHIDKGHEGLSSGMYNTFVGLGAALTASIGGLIANQYGFAPLFITVSIFSIIGSLLLSLMYKDMKTGNIFEKFFIKK